MSKIDNISYPFFIVADSWFQAGSYGMARFIPTGRQTLPINLQAREVELKLLTDDMLHAMNEITSKKTATIRKYKSYKSYEYNDRYNSPHYYHKKMSSSRDKYDSQLRAIRESAENVTFTSIGTSQGEVFIPLPVVQVSRLFAYAQRGQIIQIKCAKDTSVKVTRLSGIKPTPPKLKARMG